MKYNQPDKQIVL